MRLGVYTDYEYRSDGTKSYGQRAFVVFLQALGRGVEQLVLIGRLDPRPGSSHYPLDDATELVGLPHYESLADPLELVRSLPVSLVRLWRLLDRVDTMWVLGPYPHSVALALLTIARRRRLVLGVRQDMPAYVRSRRPEKRWMHLGADLLEAIWKALARRYPVVVVGPELARKYRRSPRLLQTEVPLVSTRDIAASADVAGRGYDGELTILTVGRIDTEKNPLLLAEILARLLERGRSWRLVVCGEGPLRAELERRLAELGVSAHADLKGYVPIDDGLLELYRSSHAFLHVSLSEGFPQVLSEAFASRLPVVATAVGGVAGGADGAALLIEPRDAGAAADALERIATEPELRARLIQAGCERVSQGTLEAATARVRAFLESA